jgi:nucleotide-binding universal stress UspA family protein
MTDQSALPALSLILNPTDGSPAAVRASEHAIYLARLTGADILVLYVVDESRARRYGVPVRREEEELNTQGEQVTRAVVERATATGVKAEALILAGQPGVTLISVARDRKASLMVMGFAGFSDLENFLLRTATVWREVLRDPPCPLLLVPDAAR